jgi:hypothetical protein
MVRRHSAARAPTGVLERLVLWLVHTCLLSFSIPLTQEPQEIPSSQGSEWRFEDPVPQRALSPFLPQMSIAFVAPILASQDIVGAAIGGSEIVEHFFIRYLIWLGGLHQCPAFWSVATMFVRYTAVVGQLCPVLGLAQLV